MIESVGNTEFSGSDLSAAVDSALCLSACDHGFAVLEGASWILNEPKPDAHAYILADPAVEITATKDGSLCVSGGDTLFTSADPWAALHDWLEPFLKNRGSSFPATIPYCAGFVSYEALHTLENVPVAANGTLALPLYQFFLYQTVIAVAGVKGLNRHYTVKYRGLEHSPVFTLAGDAKAQISKIKELNYTGFAVSQCADTLSPFSNFSRARYMSSVSLVRDMIMRGDVYQVNLSQQFRIPFRASPAEFYAHLRRTNPSELSAYMRCGSKSVKPVSIASSSPELFLRCKNGSVLCSPIKGTRPRGASPAEDSKLRNELRASEKDHAELAMIVDLVRNDLGRLARTGSVAVKQHARLESLPHVHHLVSDVVAVLRSDATLTDLIRAAFPCGSVTGTPKIAAMKAISRLEGVRRGVYTGAIGFFGLDGNCVFNVAIRTASIFEEFCVFNSGGGVVIDSDPAAEYEETIAKAHGMALALRAAAAI